MFLFLKQFNNLKIIYNYIQKVINKTIINNNNILNSKFKKKNIKI